MNPPLDLPEVAGSLADLLEGLKVPYAFGGAIAQNYWGTIRATQDIDLLVSIPRIRFEEMCRALDTAGFTMVDEERRRIPVNVEAMMNQERDRHLFTVYKGLVKVEVFLPFLPIQQSILKRAVRMPMGERKVPVTTAEDLIILKLAFHRDKDLGDVKSMLWNRREHLDLGYLREWAGRMMDAERIRELEGWIERYVENPPERP